ncbi:MAG: MBL fold metallo-hydrolase [Firmicutes bacterium]|nr:MBL fold metallo-hydrolase [Bacillota bacterium]
MAKKSSKSTKSKKQTSSPVEKAAKKAYKANPKAFIISIVAIVLVIAIATAVVYFAFPDTWDKIVSMIVKDNQHSGLARGDGELLVHMLDVGQGDCIYIQLPDGKDMVIDCANYNDDGEYEKKTFDYLDKYIEDDTVEYLMLTHCDSDHVYFMDELLERYQVEKLFMPNVLAAPGTTSKDKKALQDQIDALDTSRFTDKDTVGTITYAEFFIAALTEPDCEIVLNVDPDANTNSIIIEETTYRLVFYCPTQEYYDDYGLNTAERKNAISPIGILEYNNRKIMLTGDSNEINEPLVMARTGKIDCDVLKVGHHGSETSTSNAFLGEYTFEYAIISCNSYGNKFNHPRQATLDRLKSHNIEVYRTDNNGNIVVSVDKDGNLKITTQKESTQEQNLIGLTGTSKS